MKITSGPWEGHTISRPHVEMLPELQAERADWTARIGVRMKALDEQRQREREAEAAELAEAKKALAWCRENGNPHRAAENRGRRS